MRVNKISAYNARPFLRLLDVAKQQLVAVQLVRGPVVGLKDPCPGRRAAETALLCESCLGPLNKAGDGALCYRKRLIHVCGSSVGGLCIPCTLYIFTLPHGGMSFRERSAALHLLT